MISIILDLLAVALIIGSVLLAYRKGLIKTLFSLVGGIAAVVLAISFSEPVAAYLDSAFVGPAVRNSVLTAVNGSPLTDGYDQALESIDVSEKLQEMPESLRTFLESINIDVDDTVSMAKKNQEDSLAARKKLITDITTPISATISKAIALIALIAIFFLLLFVASLLLNAVFKVLPFGKTINCVGGVAFGLIRGMLLVMILGVILYGFAYSNTLISFEELEKTWILNWVNKINPILKLFV